MITTDITTENVMKESRLSDYNREGDEGEQIQ